MTIEKQPELFGEFKETRAEPGFFGKGQMPDKVVVFTFTREKFILLILGSVVALAVVFAFGFERGKKSVLAKRVIVQPSPIKAGVNRIPVTQEIPQPAPLKPKIAPKPYTIQVATFKSKEYAQQEAVKLRNKGFSTTIIGINGLYQVWAGDYATTKEAEQSLNMLKKAYNGCYIRKR